LPSKLVEYFVVEAFHGDAKALDARINEGEAIRLGLVLPTGRYVLTLCADAPYLDAMDKTRSDAFNHLDVSVLHQLILERELGIGAEQLAGGQHVSYTINPEEAVNKVMAGQGQAAFLLRPTRIEQVRECCGAGDKMPQKSTYFYPKLITGLVLRPLDG
jgi:uncharacterized protein (DUF1015 family)